MPRALQPREVSAYNPISAQDPRRLYGHENKEKVVTAQVTPRNPILEPDEETKSTGRKVFQQLQSGTYELFDGSHKGKARVDDESAGLKSDRHGEITQSDAPPRRGKKPDDDGGAGLSSAHDHGRGKARSHSSPTRNPVLVEGYSTGQMGDVKEYHAPDLEVKRYIFRGHLTSNLEPASEAANVPRRNRREVHIEESSLTGCAGVSTRHLDGQDTSRKASGTAASAARSSEVASVFQAYKELL